METMVKMVMDAWYVHIERADKLFTELSDEQLLHEVAPGRNRGVYLLGHLIAVHDGIPPLISNEKERYPQLKQLFLHEPDRSMGEIPGTRELRAAWADVNAVVKKQFHNMSQEDWFKRHNAVTEEAFSKEPHRNKLNIIINRTNHLSYHLGQLAFLKNRN